MPWAPEMARQLIEVKGRAHRRQRQGACAWARRRPTHAAATAWARATRSRGGTSGSRPARASLDASAMWTSWPRTTTPATPARSPREPPWAVTCISATSCAALYAGLHGHLSYVMCCLVTPLAGHCAACYAACPAPSLNTLCVTFSPRITSPAIPGLARKHSFTCIWPSFSCSTCPWL